MRTDFRTGMKLETSLKLLQLTTWACTMRPCSELPASTHRAISWSPASTGGESCGGIGPELVSPTPPLPWKHGGEKRGLHSGVLEPSPGNMSIFCREPRVMRLMGRDTLWPWVRVEKQEQMSTTECTYCPLTELVIQTF